PQPQVFFALSRVQLVGATWLKRADTPIPGIAGEQGAIGGQVVASFVSTENRDLGYSSPPGVVNEAANQGAGLSVNSTQINEQSLRLLASGLQKGQHAEAFDRFTTEGDKNLLRYRELRVWMRRRGPGHGSRNSWRSSSPGSCCGPKSSRSGWPARPPRCSRTSPDALIRASCRTTRPT